MIGEQIAALKAVLGPELAAVELLRSGMFDQAAGALIAQKTAAGAAAMVANVNAAFEAEEVRYKGANMAPYSEREMLPSSVADHYSEDDAADYDAVDQLVEQWETFRDLNRDRARVVLKDWAGTLESAVKEIKQAHKAETIAAQYTNVADQIAASLRLA